MRTEQHAIACACTRLTPIYAPYDMIAGCCRLSSAKGSLGQVRSMAWQAQLQSWLPPTKPTLGKGLAPSSPILPSSRFLTLAELAVTLP